MTVLDTLGRPLVGATVTATPSPYSAQGGACTTLSAGSFVVGGEISDRVAPWSARMQAIAASGPVTTTTAADGSADLHLEHGLYELVASHPSGGASETVTLTGLDVSDTAPLVLTVQRPAWITGRVVDAWGEPVAAAVVSLAGERRHTVTDKSGRFGFLVRPGDVQLDVRHASGIAGRSSLSLASGERATVEIAVTHRR